MTELTARRVAPGIPAWDIYADGAKLTSLLSNLPMEKAWCLTVRYRGAELDFRASTREAVLLALRCAVDALDVKALERVQEQEEDFIPDEDGEIARMRHDELKAMDFAMRGDMEEPF